VARQQARLRPDAPALSRAVRPSGLALGLALLGALAAALPACGSISRAASVQAPLRAAAEADDTAALAAIRGADPLLPLAWLVSASRCKTPEAALAVVERGLKFMPGQPQLTLARVSLLSQLGRHDEQLDDVQSALGAAPPAVIVAELLGNRIEAHLAQDDPIAAEDDVLAFGSVPGVDPAQISSAWAAVALAHAVQGRPPAADAALDRSLACGPAGLIALRQQTAVSAERADAAAGLALRAEQRHPAHPDLALFLVVEALLRGDSARAIERLQALPEPLPDRLVPDREALHARVDLIEGRPDRVLARLQPRLDGNPADTGALAVLIECWRVHGQPADAELASRIDAALPHVRERALRDALQATLDELDARARAAAPSDP
jgi:hypothetical protein